MLKLIEIAIVLSGVPVRERKGGSARFIRLSDLTEIKDGRTPDLASGEPPAVARALTIEDGDLIVAARGMATDVCVATGAVVGAFISLDLYLVRPNGALINSQYLAAFLELPATQAVFTSSKQGSGLSRLPKEALEQVEVPVPPLHSQQLIAGLALCFEREGGLFKKLSEISSILGRETVARAIRTADAQRKSIRSST
jgi:hypothetical protein